MTVNFDAMIDRLLEENADLYAERNVLDGKQTTWIFQRSMIDRRALRSVRVHLLEVCSDSAFDGPRFAAMTGAIRLSPEMSPDEAAYRLFSGELLISLPWIPAAYAVDVSGIPGRSPEEAAMDSSIRGARDGFVEEIETNVALLRKRIPASLMRLEYFTVGETHNRIALLYITDRIGPETLQRIRGQLAGLREVTLEGGNTRLEGLIQGRQTSLFPLIDVTGRPDFAVEKLLRGRFVVIFDGAPTVTIGPITLGELSLSPEDSYYPYFVAVAGRLTRYAGFLLTIFLPGFYACLLMYHQDQIPFRLLATIGLARTGVPVPAVVEMLIILFLLDTLREAGARLPRAIGNTITVVGGIIIGEAALRSGLMTPSMLAIAALAVVAGSTLVNPSLQGTVRVARLFVLLLSAVAGMFGFMISLLAFVTYMLGLESFGETYMQPLGDNRFNSGIFSFGRGPLQRTGLAGESRKERHREIGRNGKYR